MRQPTFIGVGVQKSGTTSLARILSLAGACINTKELQFSWRRGDVNDYLALFTKVPEGAPFGEFTPTYIYNTETLGNLASHFSHTKFIIALRNPVDRFYSAANHGRGEGLIPKDLDARELLDLTLNGRPNNHWQRSLVWNGFLGEHVQRAFRLLSEERVFVCFLEEISSPDTGLNIQHQLVDFLSLPRYPKKFNFPKANEAAYHLRKSEKLLRDPAVDRKLESIYKTSNDLLRRLLKRDLPWDS